MASANDLARLVVKLELQTAKYDENLKKASRQLRKFQSGQSQILSKIEAGFSTLARRVLGLAAAYASLEAISSSVKFGDDLAKLSQKSGLSAEAVSELAHAAKMADIELQSFGNAIRFMQTNLSKIGSADGKEAEQVLTAIGISLADIKDLKPDEQFTLIGAAIKKLPDIEDQTRAWQFFGKTGLEIAPMFEEGAEGIRKARLEAQQLGKSFSSSDLQRFQEVDKAFKLLKASASSLSDELVLRAGPSIAGFFDQIRSRIGGASAIEKLQADVARTKLIAESGSLRGEAATIALENYAKALERLTAAREAAIVASTAGKGMLEEFVPPGFGVTQEELDKLKPVVVTATKIFDDFNQMLKDTETDAQAGARAYEVFKIQLKSLLSEGLINAEEFNKRLDEFLNKALPEAEITAKKIQIEKALSEITVFADQAARNMQTAFADFLFDPFDKGIKGMLRGFVDILRRMVAEAAAAQIFNAIGGVSGVAGFFGSLFGAGTAASGTTIGTRASGGPVASGKPYVVGEAGPELFVPGQTGTIVPNGAMGVTQVNNIDNRGATVDAIRALPAILSENNRRLVESLRDARTRGAF